MTPSNNKQKTWLNFSITTTFICFVSFSLWLFMEHEIERSHTEVKQVVFPPGLHVLINGEHGVLFGTNHCQKHEDSENTCVVVKKNTKSVLVYVLYENSQVKEERLLVKRIPAEKGFYFREKNGGSIIAVR